MFDEVDEGTAMYKMVMTSQDLPENNVLVPLDVDGYRVPNDWYLILGGYTGKMLRGEIPLSSNMPISLDEAAAAAEGMWPTAYPTVTPSATPASSSTPGKQTPTSTPWAVITETFDANLDAGWHWVREVGEYWSLNARPGYLRVRLSPEGELGMMYLLRDKPGENFVISTRLSFEPNVNFQRAGLAIWEDDQNVLSLVRAFCDTRICEGNGLYFDSLTEGRPAQDNFATGFSEAVDVYLQLHRDGNRYSAFYSKDAVECYFIGIHIWDGDPSQVGLVIGESSVPIEVDFDEFTLSSMD